MTTGSRRMRRPAGATWTTLVLTGRESVEKGSGGRGHEERPDVDLGLVLAAAASGMGTSRMDGRRDADLLDGWPPPSGCRCMPPEIDGRGGRRSGLVLQAPYRRAEQAGGDGYAPERRMGRGRPALAVTRGSAGRLSFGRKKGRVEKRTEGKRRCAQDSNRDHSLVTRARGRRGARDRVEAG